MGRRRCYGLMASAVIVTACGSGSHARPVDAVAATVRTTASTPTTATPAPSTTIAPTTSTTAAGFTSSIAPLSDADRASMTGVSWKPGCPIGLDALRMVTLTFVDDAGAAHHDGRIVVRDTAADAVVNAFHALFDAGYPIDQMTPVDAFAGDDDASMAANNTSGFNCRPITAGTAWSRHAYGNAVDVNPLYNPWVKRRRVEPREGAAWVDRNRDDPHVIHRGDVVVRAFAAVGWGWGGNFDNLKDWQHFSADGR